MNTTDTITGAELQTLREACGLTREDFADLAGVQARTVKHWENGRAGVPGDVAALISRIDRATGYGANALLQQAADAAPSSGGEAARVVLLRYSAEEAARYPAGGELARLGRLSGTQSAALRGAMVNRAGLGLPWMPGYECFAVRVVWMHGEAYEAWRAAQGLTDSEATRAAWAVGQVAAQARPHRSDQPPGA